MTDLLERLRDMADPKRVGSHFNPLYGDAADEIERLNGVVATARASCDALALQILTLTNERDDARALARCC